MINRSFTWSGPRNSPQNLPPGHLLQDTSAPLGTWQAHLPVFLPRSQDSDLPTLLSSLHRSRHLVMPEQQHHRSRCEFQRGGVEIGLGASGKLELGSVALPLPSGPLQPLWMPPATPSLLGRQPGRPWRRGRWQAGCPPGLPVTVIVLILAGADRRRRHWLRRGCCWLLLGVPGWARSSRDPSGSRSHSRSFVLVQTFHWHTPAKSAGPPTEIDARRPCPP